MLQAMQEDSPVSLTPNCILIRRDGVESAIEDSAASASRFFLTMGWTSMTC